MKLSDLHLVAKVRDLSCAGGGARAYSIPLGVDVGNNGRSREWDVL